MEDYFWSTMSKELTDFQDKVYKKNVQDLRELGFRDIGNKGFHCMCFTKKIDKFRSNTFYIYPTSVQYGIWNWKTGKSTELRATHLESIYTAMQKILSETYRDSFEECYDVTPYE